MANKVTQITRNGKVFVFYIATAQAQTTATLKITFLIQKCGQTNGLEKKQWKSEKIENKMEQKSMCLINYIEVIGK